MNEKKLAEWYRSRMNVYTEFSERCGSVAELELKVAVYGERWTKWDWVIFLGYLDWAAYDRHGTRDYWRHEPAEPTPEENLLKDIFKEIDGGDRLDKVLTNKTVVMNIIEWLGSTDRRAPLRKYGLLRLLAHVFKKFPALWSMNWMYIRHRGVRSGKTHRLAFALPKMSSRPARYFESKAFLADFISRFWCENGTYFDENGH